MGYPYPNEDGFAVRATVTRHDGTKSSAIARGIRDDGSHGMLVYTDLEAALAKARDLDRGPAHPVTYTVTAYYNVAD